MLVYLHGLNSSGQSIKGQQLRERLRPFQVLTPDYPAHRPNEALACLERFFRALDGPAPAVVGSSMGGFYGQYLARHFTFSHLFMINPALTPWTFLAEHLGETMTTAEGERYPITRELIDSTRAYGIDDPGAGVATTLFLNRGDEVIDYRIAERHYAGHGRRLIWDGGDHAFQNMDEAIEIIRAHLVARTGSRA
ncbi:YqiA/YcfP family alpha/beta fold hydrolase [Thiocystis violacea]|uniref:YqiA/YcfP family alpha/beta fold hydrolase n=1 Tax=Thiocystis violacea TaxID=13725 RepID=UPI001903B951|nr:YqiA/YcfP family alpha/beta fold hydrolase [Thiocystis violacea]MBK1719029.1 hypothetical protein [Thiocystis violacea]